ncbi:hypothetical protein MJO29_015133 [Puccinia striiformis f. sp. tritici]|uniref:ACB domain-containing protein n=1 Tax=Puccinia striiformis f. sp. tritici PST-78 TaxID=1165861 RepID=A0A0L0VTW9_9BASI|nr:hypothetical protein Pst134EA_028186 [Puccinia striiformis f. sp. tritici]KAH9448894.1 hypothetical protein Pst134EA_028186 [Puccinia striiformis f. sp. tritici]KAI7937818.1 hypothetical protein MJO29_015133 [Puccinia striiformis f. sp. tritici]KNF02729.1 hypothetical protein, variant [Puccinia striiformis f. sp. tritici PST-78]
MAPRTTTDIRNINSASPSRLENIHRIAQRQAKQEHSSIRSNTSSLFGARSGVLPPSHWNNYNDEPAAGPDGSQEDDEDAFIEPLFQTALHIVQSSLPRSGQIQPTYNDKLLLYSLFKQAVHGDVKTSRASKRPGVFDMLGRAKWDAWKAREGLSCSEAKRLYIESVLKILHSHRDRPEARTLIESLSGYEAYTGNVDQLSDSDEDLYSEQKIEIPTSIQGSDRMGSEREGASRSTESRHKIDEQLYAQEEDDIQSARLGLYKSSSQLPDPISSSEGRRILPPHSPKANDTPSRSSSNPPSQSLSTKDHASSPPRSLESTESIHKIEHSDTSEPRFTFAQVQRLVDQTSQTLPSHSLRSPIKDLTSFSPNHAILLSSIVKLNQAIDSLQILISKIDQLNSHKLPSSTPPPDQNNNTKDHTDSLTQIPSLIQSPFSYKLNSLHPLTRPLISMIRNFWVRRFLFDISLFFFLIKAIKFFNKRPTRLP